MFLFAALGQWSLNDQAWWRQFCLQAFVYLAAIQFYFLKIENNLTSVSEVLLIKHVEFVS